MANPEIYQKSPIAVASRPNIGYNHTTSEIVDRWLIRFNEMSKEAKQIEYPDELKLQEVLSEGIPMLIPRGLLFGRQENDNYEHRKRRAIEQELEKDRNYLSKHPIIVCGIPSRTNQASALELIIIDGHHRVRYSSEFDIRDIPSIVYTPEQIAEAFNIKNKTNYDAGTLIQLLHEETAEAVESFRNMPEGKKPTEIHGYSSISELPFPRFTKPA